jgi:hypothetical protein
LGSANDGAVWINRITTANYSQIVYSIDWAHAHGRLSNVAKAAFGDGTPQAQQWTQQQVDLLWHGRVEDVVTAWRIFAIHRLTLKRANTTWIMRASEVKDIPLVIPKFCKSRINAKNHPKAGFRRIRIKTSG